MIKKLTAALFVCDEYEAISEAITLVARYSKQSRWYMQRNRFYNSDEPSFCVADLLSEIV